jgi:hypothetical protein
LQALVGHQKTVVGIGYDDRRNGGLQALQSGKRSLKEAAFFSDTQKLLRPHRPRERPES